MNAEMLSNTVDVELISEGTKYSVKVSPSPTPQYCSQPHPPVLQPAPAPPPQVSRLQPTVYALLMNSSMLEIEVHRMSDGSLLLSYNGTSYNTYLKEEVDKYRVVISGKTCVFDKENDPRVLR